mgnify:CR=1 FL=1
MIFKQQFGHRIHGNARRALGLMQCGFAARSSRINCILQSRNLIKVHNSTYFLFYCPWPMPWFSRAVTTMTHHWRARFFYQLQQRCSIVYISRLIAACHLDSFLDICCKGARDRKSWTSLFWREGENLLGNSDAKRERFFFWLSGTVCHCQSTDEKSPASFVSERPRSGYIL